MSWQGVWRQSHVGDLTLSAETASVQARFDPMEMYYW
eukprot:COSAG01_NODE_364_length_18090_cov_40.740870_2_plen_37_part_00